MNLLSDASAYNLLWTTYGILLVSATFVAFKERDNSAFISANGTQTALPLALNFIASGIGCGSLSAYPQIANIAGIHGLLVYALAGGLPMLLFAFLGPLIKRKVPNGFVLTEWVFQRYGLVTGWYLSLCTLLTVFLFMVSDVAALKFAISSISNVNVTYAIIVEAIVTTIYTSLGGFQISFITDSLQVTIVFALITVVTCAIGEYVEIDTSRIEPSGLLKTNKLGWQLVYILTLAIFTNDFFMSGFWLRTFAAKTNRDLLTGCSIACIVLVVFSTVVGSSGLLAVWADLMPVADKERSGSAFFILISHLPNPVIGLTLVMIATLSTCTFDSLQSAMVSSLSNDLFRNRISIVYARSLVVFVMLPVIVIGLVAEDILKIYLFVDLLSSSVVPVLVVGLWNKMDTYWTGWEVVSGGFGGLLCVWIFGTVYYQSAYEGFHLLFLANGIYVDDWSSFGAFVAAPLGGLFTGFSIMHIRLTCERLYSNRSSKFHRFCTNLDAITGITAVRNTILDWETSFLGPSGILLTKKKEDVSNEESTSEGLPLTKLQSPIAYATC